MANHGSTDLIAVSIKRRMILQPLLLLDKLKPVPESDVMKWGDSCSLNTRCSQDELPMAPDHFHRLPRWWTITQRARAARSLGNADLWRPTNGI